MLHLARELWGKLKKVNGAGRGVKRRVFDILVMISQLPELPRLPKSPKLKCCCPLRFSIVTFGNRGPQTAPLLRGLGQNFGDFGNISSL
jgi:hypothetical protein